VIKQSAQVGWLAGGKYFVCDAGYLELNSGLNRRDRQMTSGGCPSRQL